LQNALQFAVVKCREETLEPRHLPPHLLGHRRAVQPPAHNAGGMALQAGSQPTPGPGTPGQTWGAPGSYNWQAPQGVFPGQPLPALLPPIGEGRNKLTAEAVYAALARTDGNKAKAARLLGVGRATLYRFLRKADGG